MRPGAGGKSVPIERFIGPLLGLDALLLYARTMAPSLGGTIDSPEFQQATYSLSIVHPTGYPLYLLVGRLWISIFPFGDPAFRVNLLSVIYGALAVWVLYETVRYLTGNLFAAASAAALFAVQPVPWATSSVAEINSLNTLLTGLAFYCVVLWAAGRLPLPVAALALGVDLSHHRTSVLYLPLLILFALAALRWGRPRRGGWRTLSLSLFLLLLPFAAYVYLPLRGFTTDWYANTWGGFWTEVLGESALPVIQGALGRPLLPRFKALLFGQTFSGAAGWALLVLGLLGAGYAVWRLWSRRSGEPAGEVGADSRLEKFKAGTFLLYAAAFAVGISFASLYDILDVTDYLGVPTFMWCVTAGAGLALAGMLAAEIALRLAAASSLRLALQVSLLACIAALCIYTGFRSLHRSDLQVDFGHLDRQTFWNDVKAQDYRMRKGGILIGDWPEANEALYMQYVEHWRTDLHIAKVDDVLSGDGKQIDRWLEQKQPVYMMGEHINILSRYDATRKGEVWLITGSKPPEKTPPMQHTLNRRYGDSITLVGYTLEPDPPVLGKGGLLNVTLYWKTDARLNERYVIFNHVIDASGGKIGQKDDEPGRGFNPTTYWEPGKIQVDTFPVAISPDAAPSTYRLISGMYTRLGDKRLPAFSADGQPLGDYPEVTTVTVK